MSPSSSATEMDGRTKKQALMADLEISRTMLGEGSNLYSGRSRKSSEDKKASRQDEVAKRHACIVISGDVDFDEI
jgi:hypothetical protein